MMRLAGVASALLAIAAPALAMDQTLVRQFKALDPQTRLEQRCDTEAMWKITADKAGYKPDKVIAYAFADPVIEDDGIRAAGAVFRSKGEWYKLRFACDTGPDHIEVLSFNYKIGERVPHEDWDEHYLYP